jgi:hypothetical protein
MSIHPNGENLRNAVKWISAQHQDQPDTPMARLIDKASLTFNLTPAEADSLTRLLADLADD